MSRANLSDPLTPLVDAPRHKGRLSVIGAVTSSLQAIGGVEFDAGRQTQNEAGSYLDVPSFVTASAKVVWTIRRRLDVEAAILNAFDEYYWVADGYPGAGRTALATVRWRF